jgi:hypothetical protein
VQLQAFTDEYIRATLAFPLDPNLPRQIPGKLLPLMDALTQSMADDSPSGQPEPLDQAEGGA